MTKRKRTKGFSDAENVFSFIKKLLELKNKGGDSKAETASMKESIVFEVKGLKQNMEDSK